MARQQTTSSNHFLVLAGVALIAALWAGSSVAYAKVGEFAADKQQLVDRINHERAAHDLKKLARHAALDATAQDYAERMAAQNLFGHELDKTTPPERAVAHGYPTRIIGETISWQSSLNPSEVVTQWLASEVHRGILLGDYGDIGVGLVKRQDGTYFWVVVVGRASLGLPEAPSRQ